MEVIMPHRRCIGHHFYIRMIHGRQRYVKRNVTILFSSIRPTRQNQQKKNTVAGMQLDSDDKDASYHGLFPMIQLWRPAVEYPLWDDNWDGRQIQQQATVGGEEHRRIRKEGVTRHIILIRHGQVRILGLVNIDTLQLIAIRSSFFHRIQYDETYKVRASIY
jgi:hypothetical protein